MDALAICAAVATAKALPVTGLDVSRFWLLVACAAVHVELSRGNERSRRLRPDSGSFVDGLTPWHFAGVLMLPPVLASALVLFTRAYGWLRIWHGRRPAHRLVFHAATVLLATQVSAMVLDNAPGMHPGIPHDRFGPVMVLVAAVLHWLVNYVVVLGWILVSTRSLRAARVAHDQDEQILEGAAIGLGMAAAGLLEFQAWLLIGIVIGLVALHRGLLLPQFRQASRTDGKTGLYTATWWHQIAEHVVERAPVSGTGVAVLMLDLDHFKRINDTWGHLAGDKVLRAVADTITSAVRDYDDIGRWGGEEFAVLLPGVGATQLWDIAERVRRDVRELVVEVGTTDDSMPIADLTISIGGARYPAPGIASLDDLLVAADTALYSAKRAGRDRVHVSAGPPRPRLRRASPDHHDPTDG